MEIYFIFLIIFLGIISGILTGLIPGIHINLISVFIISNLVFFLEFLNKEYLIIFIIVMGTIHSFIDFIPSVLFGVPSPDTALSVLPAHRLVNNGQAYFAIFLSSLGSLIGMIFSFLFMILFFFFLSNLYDSIKFLIPYFLILILIILILFEDGKNKKFWSIIIVLFSGALGLLVLNSKLFNDPMLPLFTGLFGISTILLSFKNKSKIPSQNFEIDFKYNSNYLKSSIIAGITSVFASISPGVGNAQAATISSIFFRKMNSQIFIFVISSINTSNYILSFITFYLINKARNGSVIAISQIVEKISINEIKLYLIIIFIVGIIGFFLTLKIGKIIIKNIFKFDERKINASILVFLIFIVLILGNIYSLLLLLTATFLGLLSISLNVGRVHLMSVLIIPVIFYLI